MIREYQNIRVQRVGNRRAFNAYKALNLDLNPLPFEFCQYLFSHKDGYIVAVAIDDYWSNEDLKALIHLLLKSTYDEGDCTYLDFTRANQEKTVNTLRGKK